MSRVAVRPSNGDNIEKLAFLAPLVGAVGRKLATSALGQGFTAARGGTGIMGKIKEGVKAYGKAKVKDATTGEDGKTDGAATAAKLAQQTMANQAQARQDRLQNQKEHNMQMADRAKQNSQIAAGEPMDMSWRLLKDWSWNHELSPRARRAIVERARKAKKKQQYSHIHPVPSRHHDDQFAERYHPHQKMPQDAAGLEPHEVAGAMADLFLENHPELRQALEEELPHPADPNQTNTPGMVFHALSTDDPKISDNTSWDTYAPVIAKPNMFAKPMVHTAVNSPISQASNRHTIRVSTVQDYPHSHARHNEILPSKFNLVDPLSGLPVSRGEAEKLRQDYRIRQLGGSEEKWRNKILDVEGEKSDKIVQDLTSRLHNEAMLSEREDAEEAKRFETQQAREQQLSAREQGELQVKAGPMPGIYYVTDPAFGFEEEMITQGNPNVGQGYDYYHNHYQNQQTVQTGEPMDLAWRMLKQMSDEEMQEWAYENLRNQGITIPDEREEEVVPKPEIPTLYY